MRWSSSRSPVLLQKQGKYGSRMRIVCMGSDDGVENAGHSFLSVVLLAD